MEPVQPKFTASYASENSKEFDIKKVILVLASVIFVIIIYTYISSPMIVTVTGSGQVAVPATNATVSFTLSATDGSVSSAVSSVQGKSEEIRNFLRTSGVAEGDIAVSQVTAVPSGLVTQGATGYQATVSMAAKTIHVNNIGSLISDLYAKGALVVAQPILSVENQNKLEQEALDSAMKDARGQASKIGMSNWKFIRKIIGISQASSGSTSTATTKDDTSTNGVFKIVKAVSVSYKMW